VRVLGRPPRAETSSAQAAGIGVDRDSMEGHYGAGTDGADPDGPVATGCWYNLVNQHDLMVAPPWRPARWFRR